MKKILLAILLLAAIIYAAYEALIVYDNDFRYGRMRETPAVRPHEQPLLTMEAGVVPFSGGEENFKARAAENLVSPLTRRDPENIRRGRWVYFTFCAQCHGNRYDGNGTVGQSFSPLPADLKSARVQSRSEGRLFKEISYGIPGGRQPPLATTIDLLDRWRVVAYVKSLGTRK